MANGFNKVILVGRIVGAPVLKNVGDKVMVYFKLGTTETIHTQAGDKSVENWHSVIAWADLAAKIDRFGKPDMQVMVEGRLHSRKYVDAKGEQRYVTEVVAFNCLFLSPKDGDPEPKIERHPEGGDLPFIEK